MNYVRVTLHKALAQAVSDGPVHRNVAQAKAPRPERPEIKPLSPDQARRLLAPACGTGDGHAALYAPALHTGPREGEKLDFGGTVWSSTPPRRRYRYAARSRRLAQGMGSGHPSPVGGALKSSP